MKLLRKPPGARFAGFTLIELLTVISIIAILAAASFAGYGKIVEGVRKKEAAIMAVTIGNSVDQFYGDYNKLPKPESASEGDDSETTTEASEGLVMVLLGKEGDADTVQNPRKTDYLDGLKQAKPSKRKRDPGASAGSDKWANGLVYEQDQFEIVDGWGNYYKVVLDTNYDKELENPNSEEVAEGRPILPRRVAVWSAGKDGKEDTWIDNVKSWE